MDRIERLVAWEYPHHTRPSVSINIDFSTHSTRRTVRTNLSHLQHYIPYVCDTNNY